MRSFYSLYESIKSNRSIHIRFKSHSFNSDKFQQLIKIQGEHVPQVSRESLQEILTEIDDRYRNFDVESIGRIKFFLDSAFEQRTFRALQARAVKEKNEVKNLHIKFIELRDLYHASLNQFLVSANGEFDVILKALKKIEKKITEARVMTEANVDGKSGKRSSLGETRLWAAIAKIIRQRNPGYKELGYADDITTLFTRFYHARMSKGRIKKKKFLNAKATQQRLSSLKKMKDESLLLDKDGFIYGKIDDGFKLIIPSHNENLTPIEIAARDLGMRLLYYAPEVRTKS